MPTDCSRGASPWYEDGRVRCADVAIDCHYQHATMLVYARAVPADQPQGTRIPRPHSGPYGLKTSH